MVYSESVMEAIKFKLHNSGNNTTIAREIKNEFNLPMEVEILRRTISRIRERYKIKPNTRIKRLFFDIETGYYTCRLWHIGKVGYVSPDTIISDKPIICISYKWQDEDVVHNLDWSMGEKEMLQSFVSILHEASEVVGHNSDRFDLREIRTKCLYYGIPIPPEIRSLDTLKKSREYFNFASNKLDYIGKYLNLGKKLPHEGFQLWVDVVENKKPEALQKMIAYCITPDHKLLKDDFRWYKAEDLKVGDKVLGFDEHSTIHNRRKFKESIIERIEYDIAPVYEVKLSSGKIFKVTEEHQWLVKKGNDYMWKQTNQLSTNEKYPTRISKVLDMWEEDNSKEAGWLAGMFDGEGCLSYRGNVHKDGIKALTNLSISQRPTPTLKKLEYLLTSFSELYGKRTTKKESDCITLHLYGNKYKKLKFLGTIRPERLLDKLKFNFLGSFEARAGDETVVSVTPMGEQKIIKIQTSTGTFICDGYAHHNCNQDVILLEDVYHALAPYITHNNNFGTLLGGDKHYCPECASNDVILDKTYTTATGTIKRRMRCNKCGKYYVVSNKTYIDFLQETLK